MKRLIGLLLVSLVAVVLPSISAQAQSDVYVTPTAADAADLIVNGTVLSTESFVLEGFAHRVSEIQISSAPKGSVANNILVEVPGGDLPDGTTMYVSHTPELIEGEQVQVALTPLTGSLAEELSLAADSALEVYSVVGGLDGAYGLLPDGVGRAEAVGDYSLNGSSWATFAPSVDFYVNPANSNSGLSNSTVIAEVNDAFKMWEDDPHSAVDFRYAGTTSKTGVNLADRQNTVSFGNYSAGWLAQASWIATSAGDTLEFDIRVNTRYGWSSGPVGGRWDISTTVGHEVGHGLGLNHAPASSELMYSTISSGRTKGLGLGDRSGVGFLYPSTSGYVGLTPARLLDTRNSIDGPYSTSWSPGETRSLQVAGRGGVPATGVTAVAMNITSVNPTASKSSLTVFPAGTTRPVATSLTFGTGSTAADLVNGFTISKLGVDGSIDIYNQFGNVDVVVDVVGYFSGAAPAGFKGINPSRILDTRNNFEGQFATPWSTNETRTIQVAGLGGVPDFGAEAVALNVTSVHPTADYSYLTVWPAGQPQPFASALNFGRGPGTTQIVNSLVIAKVGWDGQVNIFNQQGSVDVVVDVVGYFSASNPDRFSPQPPGRFLDTVGGIAFTTPWGPTTTRTFGTVCKSVVFHATTSNVTAPASYLTIRPGLTGGPFTSAHNFGQSVSHTADLTGLVIASANSQGGIEIYNNSGSTDLTLDGAGGFGCS